MARLFFALWPPPDTAAFIAGAARAAGGRPVRQDALHLTLAFLGDVGEDDRSALPEPDVTAVAGGLTLELDRTGYWRRRRLAWLAPSTPPPVLLTLQSDLAGRLRSAGFALQRRPFRPHVTLARRAPGAPPAPEPAIIWPVHEVVLVESVLGPQGAAYHRRAAWRLGGCGGPGGGGSPGDNMK